MLCVFGADRADWSAGVRPDTVTDIEHAYTQAHWWGVDPWPALKADMHAALLCASGPTFTAAGVEAAGFGGQRRIVRVRTEPLLVAPVGRAPGRPLRLPVKVIRLVPAIRAG